MFLAGQKPIRRPNLVPPTKPQATLYVRNLNEKLKVATVVEGLTTIFSQFGRVVEIKMKHHLKHRGQAFVSFESIEVASQAKLRSNGFPLFDKPMDVQFAKEPSFAVSELDGDENLQSHKRKRQEGGRFANLMIAAKKEDSVAKKVKPKAGEDIPNSILFIQNLPLGTKEIQIQELFSTFQGFKEIRMVPGKSDIAFVEYDTEIESGLAKQSLHGYRISPEKEIKVTFAKK